MFSLKCQVPLDESIQITNGGTGMHKGNLIFSNSGRASLPPNIALVNPKSPYNSTILLNNYYGRQFNSLNDIKIHPGSGKFFFVDDMYVVCLMPIFTITFMSTNYHKIQIWIPRWSPRRSSHASKPSIPLRSSQRHCKGCCNRFQ